MSTIDIVLEAVFAVVMVVAAVLTAGAAAAAVGAIGAAVEVGAEVTATVVVSAVADVVGATADATAAVASGLVAANDVAGAVDSGKEFLSSDERNTVLLVAGVAGAVGVAAGIAGAATRSAVEATEELADAAQPRFDPPGYDAPDFSLEENDPETRPMGNKMLAAMKKARDGAAAEEISRGHPTAKDLRPNINDAIIDKKPAWKWNPTSQEEALPTFDKWVQNRNTPGLSEGSRLSTTGMPTPATRCRSATTLRKVLSGPPISSRQGKANPLDSADRALTSGQNQEP